MWTCSTSVVLFLIMCCLLKTDKWVTEQSLMFLLSHSRSRARVRGERWSREERGLNLSSFFTINLHKFTFSPASARGSDRSRSKFSYFHFSKKIVADSNFLFLADRKVFLATWKDIPAENEVQNQVSNIMFSSGKTFSSHWPVKFWK